MSIATEPPIARLRRLCLALPAATERLSHGEPAWFVGKRASAVAANNHHNDGWIALWLPVPPKSQAMLIAAVAAKFFRPPYVGVRGWVGIELGQIDDDELAHHLDIAWRLVALSALPRPVLDCCRR